MSKHPALGDPTVRNTMSMDQYPNYIIDPTSGASLRRVCPLGSGASADVVLVQGSYGEYTGHLACKILKGKGGKCNPAAKEFLYKEIISHLLVNNHENVVRYFGSFADHHNFYIVMEYCANGTLQALLGLRSAFRLPLNEMEIRFFLKPMLSALDYMHYKGVAHRDLKPGNVLLSEHFQVKIADFGISDFTNLGEDGRFLKGRVGSPNFISPEALFGDGKEYDIFASDIWSAGCIIYNLAFLVAPFEQRFPDGGVNINMTLQKARDGIYTFSKNRSISEELRSLIEKCLVMDPKDRPSAFTLKVDSYFQKFTPSKVTYDITKHTSEFESEREAFDRAAALYRAEKQSKSRFGKLADLV